jgi:hypothetical protein
MEVVEVELLLLDKMFQLQEHQDKKQVMVEQVQIQLQYLDQDFLIQEFIQVVEEEELDLVQVEDQVGQNLV